MKNIYFKPCFKVKVLRSKPLLQQGSNIHMGGYGKFDAKACSYYFYEEDIYDEGE